VRFWQDLGCHRLVLGFWMWWIVHMLTDNDVDPVIWGHDPLCMTVGWQPTMVKYCMMHTLHLGLCHWVNAGALLTLIHHNFFGSSTARKNAKSTSNLNRLFPSKSWHPRHPNDDRDHALVESPIPRLVPAAYNKPRANLHWYSTFASRGLGRATAQGLC